MKKRLTAFLLAIYFGTILAGCNAHTHAYTATVVPSTCTTIGYTIHTCSCGDTYYSDYRALTAHSYGEWISGTAATLTEGGEEYRICKNCGDLQTEDTESSSALAKLYLTSDGILTYSDGDMRFSCEVTAATDDGGVKPNYELSFFQNGGAYAVDLGWGGRSTYRLRTCGADMTFSRAAAAQAMWKACIDTRQEDGALPDWYAETVSDGFPVQLYTDGEYAGLYRLIPGTDWAYICESYHDSPTASIRAEDESASCLFLDAPLYTETADAFTVLYHSTGDIGWAYESFDGFSQFVRQAKDAAFREQLSQYTDPETLIDYFLFTVLFGADSGDTAGTVWTTADGVHWIPSFSDPDTAFGLTADGTLAEPYGDLPAMDEDGELLYTGGNLLWSRLCEVFGKEIIARYAELRKTNWNADLLYDMYLQVYGEIEYPLFATETQKYGTDGYALTGSADVYFYLEDCLQAMDTWLGYDAEQ